MAYKNFDDLSQVTDSGVSNNILKAEGPVVDLPDASYVRDAALERDGADLILNGPEGSITVEGYFSAAESPDLVVPGGETLTPDLVNAFARSPQQFASNSSLTDESPVGSVDEITGDATVTRLDGSTEQISLGTEIYQGDIIETAGDGAVNVSFIDDTSFAVSNDARLAIDEYVFDPSTDAGSQNFSVLKGVFVFTSGLIGRDDPDDVNIDTPTGSIGIRGTIIAGNADTGEITVVEGAIVVRDLGGNEVTLANQFETAKIDASGQDVRFLGQLEPQEVADKFSDVSDVAPTLFSSIEDAVNENNDNAENAGDDRTQQKEAAEGEKAVEEAGDQIAPEGEAHKGEEAGEPAPKAAPETTEEAKENFDADGSVDQDGDGDVDGTIDETAGDNADGNVGEENAGEGENTGDTATGENAGEGPRPGTGPGPGPTGSTLGTDTGSTGTTSGTETNTALAGSGDGIDPIISGNDTGNEDPISGPDPVGDGTGDSTLDPDTDPNAIIRPPIEDSGVLPRHFFSEVQANASLDLHDVGSLAPNGSAAFGGANFFQASSQQQFAYNFEAEFTNPGAATTYFLSEATKTDLNNSIDILSWNFDVNNGRLEVNTGTVAGDTLTIEIGAQNGTKVSGLESYSLDLVNGTAESAASIITGAAGVHHGTNGIDTNQLGNATTPFSNGKFFAGNGNDNIILFDSRNSEVFLGEGTNQVTLNDDANNTGNKIFGGNQTDTFIIQNDNNDMFGMNGNDTFKLDLDANQTGAGIANATVEGILDGGAGYDSLILESGIGGVLDLSAANNIRGIERIDLNTNTAIQINDLELHEIIEMTDGRNELKIDGTAGDVINFNIGAGDRANFQLTDSAGGYDTYFNAADNVTLVIDQDVSVSGTGIV